MRNMGAWPRRRLVIQVGIAGKRRFGCAILYDGCRVIALVHLHAMGLEFVALDIDRLGEQASLLCRIGAVVAKIRKIGDRLGGG